MKMIGFKCVFWNLFWYLYVFLLCGFTIKCQVTTTSKGVNLTSNLLLLPSSSPLKAVFNSSSTITPFTSNNLVSMVSSPAVSMLSSSAVSRTISLRTNPPLPSPFPSLVMNSSVLLSTKLTTKNSTSSTFSTSKTSNKTIKPSSSWLLFSSLPPWNNSISQTKSLASMHNISMTSSFLLISSINNLLTKEKSTFLSTSLVTNLSNIILSTSIHTSYRSSHILSSVNKSSINSSFLSSSNISQTKPLSSNDLLTILSTKRPIESTLIRTISPSSSSVKPQLTVVIYSTMVPCWVTAFVPYENATQISVTPSLSSINQSAIVTINSSTELEVNRTSVPIITRPVNASTLTSPSSNYSSQPIMSQNHSSALKTSIRTTITSSSFSIVEQTQISPTNITTLSTLLVKSTMITSIKNNKITSSINVAVNSTIPLPTNSSKIVYSTAVIERSSTSITDTSKGIIKSSLLPQSSQISSISSVVLESNLSSKPLVVPSPSDVQSNSISTASILILSSAITNKRRRRAVGNTNSSISTSNETTPISLSPSLSSIVISSEHNMSIGINTTGIKLLMTNSAPTSTSVEISASSKALFATVQIRSSDFSTQVISFKTSVSSLPVTSVPSEFTSSNSTKMSSTLVNTSSLAVMNKSSPSSHLMLSLSLSTLAISLPTLTVTSPTSKASLSTLTPSFSMSQKSDSQSNYSTILVKASTSRKLLAMSSSGYYISALSSCLETYSTIVWVVPSIHSTLMKTIYSKGISSKYVSSVKQTLSISSIAQHTQLVSNSLQHSTHITSALSTASFSFSTEASSSVVLSPSVSITPSSSTSVVPTTTVTPTTTTAEPSIDNLLLLVLENVDSSISVTSGDFIDEMEKKLVATYVAAKKLGSKRKRRVASLETSQVEVNQTKRSGLNVDVQFQVFENNATVPPTQAKATYDKLSVPYLQTRLGYQVSRPITLVSSVSSSYTSGDVVAIVLVDSPTSNISEAANQTTFKENLATFYKTGKGISEPVAVELIPGNVRHEIGNIVYAQFYILVDNIVQNASYVVAFFQTKTLDQLSSAINPQQALQLPYPANREVVASRENYVKMKISPPANTDTASSVYKTSLAQKISDVYLTGKQTKSSRKKRAVGSVETKMIALIGSDPLEVVFAIIDRGTVVGATQAASVMNNAGQTNMQDLLGAQVVSLPEPVLVTPASSIDDVKYWIIGVVAGGVLIMALIFVLICWRWMKGGPAKKNDVPIDQVDMGPNEMKDFPPVSPTTKAKLRVEEDEGREHVHIVNNKSSKDAMSVPLFAPNKHPNDYKSDDLRTSQRAKVQRRSLKARTHVHSRQNPAYNPSIPEEESEEEEEEEEGSEEEEYDEEEIEQEPLHRAPQPTPLRRSLRRQLDYDAHERTHPQQRFSKSPKRPPRNDEEIYGRRPLEMTGNVMRPDTQNTSFTADQIPTFNHVNERKGYNINPPIRFRTNIENNMDAYTKPSGPLPLLDLKQTSLVNSAPIFNKPVDPDIEHKTEIERMRNKQRQREQAFTNDPLSTQASSSQSGGRFSRSWRREQEKINSILDPLATDLSQRKGRLRRKLRRKNKIYIAPDTSGYSSDNRKSKPGDVVLKSYKSNTSRSSTAEKLYDEDEAGTGDESEISMQEARRRIHSLLDDTFQTLKKYKKQLGDNESPEARSSPQKATETNPSMTRSGSLPRRYPSSMPALTNPATPHQVPTAVTPGANAGGRIPNPYTLPQYPQYPVYADPLVTWDPMERQRYMNQRVGYPAYGPAVNSLSYPYENPNQNVYITPVHQRPDGTGGMMWSPYPVGTMPHGNEFMTQTGSIPGESRNADMDYIKATQPRNTTIDINDIGSLKKDGSGDSQPLIRAIKEELLKLSHSAQGKTRIQELRSVVPS